MKSEVKKQVAQKLARYLSDTYVLYVKTQNFHWNMEGEEFFMYHKLLEEQYEALAEAADELAERIRQLGEKAPHGMTAFLEKATLCESSSTLSQKEMIEILVRDHTFMVENGEELIAFCDTNGDPGTSDMVVGRIRDHDKQAWLLKSHYQ
jgi:starvation-inducible DNA-binding protein